MKISFIEESVVLSDNIIIICDDKLENISKQSFIKKLEEETKVSIAKILEIQKFEGKFKKMLRIVTASNKIANILIFSVGSLKDLSENQIVEMGGNIVVVCERLRLSSAQLLYSLNCEVDKLREILFNISFGALLRSYRFDKYKTKKKSEDKEVRFEKLDIPCPKPQQANSEFERYITITEGVKLTKDLISEPPNVLNPETFSRICKELTKYGVEVEVLDKEKMTKLGMGALLGVAQGSVNEPKLVVMKWLNAADKKEAPMVFVGKGVTFDSGGLSLKPASYMVGMKCDMGGAAVVTGLIKVLAARQAKVNVIGAIGLVENMPDGNAQRPDDIVTSMSGQTIEVLNTDAEGRLVLSDVLWYVQDKYKPKFIVDLATLTGAIVVSLGSEYAGLFSNNDKISEQLFKSGIETNEKVWRLPLSKEYDKLIDSKIADMKNIGGEKGGAGSITAAQFLQRFVNDVPWAHLDIAGVTDANKGSELHSTAATGFGVRLLNDFIERNYEK
jgi:leucyl aminopeptidase